MKIVLLGPPAAGKGTQAKELSEHYDIPTISTGAMIRREISAGTEIGKKAKKFIDDGQLVPDEMILELLLKRISEPDCKNGYILDGYPRTVGQAETAEKMGIIINKVILFNVPDEEIVKRITGRRECKTCNRVYHIVNNPPATENVCDNCGSELSCRADDNRETVEKRLAVYHSITEPLKDFYSNKGILVAIEGKETIADTTSELLKVLGD